MICEEYLMGYRNALEDIRDIDLQIMEEELRQQKMAASYEGVLVKGTKDANAKLDPLGDLILRKKELEEKAEAKRKEIRKFISSVGGGSEEDKRSRQILRLYYAENLEWREVQRLIKPLKERRDGRKITNRNRCVSHTTLFRARLDALAKAEKAWARLSKYR